MNPAVGESERQIFLPVWAFNAAEIRYQNYAKSWAMNASVAVRHRDGMETLECGKEMKFSPKIYTQWISYPAV